MSGFVLLGRCGHFSIAGHRSNRRMGRRKYNLCTKCGFRHAAPTGRACTVCAAGDGAQLPDDKSISSGQGPNLEGLDARDDAQRRQKAVSVVERVEKIEKDMGAMDGKNGLDISIYLYVQTNHRLVIYH